MADKKTSSAKTPSKSEFIREQPSSMPAAELIDKAKAAGLTIDTGLIYGVRSREKAKGKTKKSRGKSAPAVTNGSAKKPTSKADYVRAHAGLSPKAIVEKAKAAGIELGVGYVYNVRGGDKSAPKGRSRPSRSKQTASKGVGRTSIPAHAKVEELLKAVAAEIGLGRAIEILGGERARVKAVLGG
ncbi:MAG: hypothetical protein ABSC94_13165 [Polyangiaceae bacterium]|jgi:hypothetical protein